MKPILFHAKQDLEKKYMFTMAKTTASLVLLVICMALILNGYSVVEGARRGNQMEKGEDRIVFGLPFYTICSKLRKLCLANPPKYCVKFIKKCKN